MPLRITLYQPDRLAGAAVSGSVPAAAQRTNIRQTRWCRWPAPSCRSRRRWLGTLSAPSAILAAAGGRGWSAADSGQRRLRVMKQHSGRLPAGELVPSRAKGLSVWAGTGNATRVFPARARWCAEDRQVRDQQKASARRGRGGRWPEALAPGWSW